MNSNILDSLGQFSNWKIRNSDRLDLSKKGLNIFTIVCPLFKDGLLSKSELIDDPHHLNESRIFNKWIEFCNIADCLNQTLRKENVDIVFNIVFADKAVPLKEEKDIHNVLRENFNIWKREAGDLSKRINCKINPLVCASDLIPTVPDVLEIGSFKSVNNDRDIILKVDAVLRKWFGHGVVDVKGLLRDKKRMDIVKRLRKFFGFDLTVILLLNYISLDWEMVNSFDIDLSINIERFGLLLALSRFTKGLDSLPILEVSV